MADYSKTISNSLVFFGPADTSRWGTMEWGTNVWGSDNDLDFTVGKWLSESVTLSASHSKSVTRSYGNTMSLGTSVNRAYYDGNGYYYVIDGANDPDNAYIPPYTESSDASSSYSEVTASSTTWSAA